MTRQRSQEQQCCFSVAIHYRERRVRTGPRAGAVYLVGDVSGYETMTHRGRFNLRARKYHAWCRRVRLCALGAHFYDLPLPSKDAPVRIDVDCYFRPGVRHPEPENVRKGVVDALYYRPRGRHSPSWLSTVRRRSGSTVAGTQAPKKMRQRIAHVDRWVFGSHGPPQYDAERPRVEITVSTERQKD